MSRIGVISQVKDLRPALGACRGQLHLARCLVCIADQYSLSMRLQGLMCSWASQRFVRRSS